MRTITSNPNPKTKVPAAKQSKLTTRSNRLQTQLESLVAIILLIAMMGSIYALVRFVLTPILARGFLAPY